MLFLSGFFFGPGECFTFGPVNIKKCTHHEVKQRAHSGRWDQDC